MPSERLLREAHPELFHYTGIDGLTGILRSQCFWATHWQHLNDAKELEHFAAALPKLIKPGRVGLLVERARLDPDFAQWVRANGGPDLLCDEESRDLAKAMFEALLNPDPTEQLLEFYVASFCTAEGAYEGVRDHGLLSQWQCYGRRGGYAIVLETAEIERLMCLENDRWKCRISLGEVGYSSDSQDLLQSRIEALPTLLRAVSACEFASEKDCEPLLGPLLDCAIHYKHWCFAEEREVRLVAVLNGPKVREAYQKDGTEWVERERHDGDGKPRIHLFDGLDVKGSPCGLPIKRILVGPGPNQRDRETKLRSLLEELQHEIPVTFSDMPIRFWAERD